MRFRRGPKEKINRVETTIPITGLQGSGSGSMRISKVKQSIATEARSAAMGVVSGGVCRIDRQEGYLGRVQAPPFTSHVFGREGDREERKEYITHEEITTIVVIIVTLLHYKACMSSEHRHGTYSHLAIYLCDALS